MKPLQQKADTLIEALAYIKKFKGKIVVIKYGGGALDESLPQGSVFEDINMLTQLGLKVIFVHGGGPMIDVELGLLGITKATSDGLRVTDAPTLKVVVRVLGNVNHGCVAKLQTYGLSAENCTGNAFTARIKSPALGFVGGITSVNVKMLREKLGRGVIPVVSSLATGVNGQLLNVNADTAATQLAVALGAEKLTLLTNVDGVMLADNTLASHLSVDESEKYIASGTISGGMIPKVRACATAVTGGVAKAHLMNAATKRALLLEIFTDAGVGTEIVL